MSKPETDEIVLGLETELGVVGLGRDLRRRDRVVRHIVQHVAATQPHAWGACDKHSAVLFLANGAACGLDPPWPTLEYSTPECLDPFELAASLRAGMHLVAAAAQYVASDFRCRIMPVAASYFYIDDGVTLGTHENYGVFVKDEGALKRLRRGLLPWLVCRQLLTEPGVLSRSDGAAGFALAPRAHLMFHLASTSTTRSRGIFTVGRTHYAGAGWRRLHVISAGASLSPWVVSLRHGVTALLIRMIMRGWEPPSGLRLREPLAALRAVSRRPFDAVASERGAVAPADILEALCGEVRRAHDAKPLAGWAERLLAEWERGLVVWRQGGEAQELWLEAPLKRHMFDRYLKSEAVTWSQICLWGYVLDGIQAVYVASGKPRPAGPRELVDGLPEGIRANYRLKLEREGFSWDDLPRLREIVKRLQVLDVELARIDDGMAERQAAGRRKLGVAVLEAPLVQQRMTRPPERTRARARSRLIERHREDERLKACWNLVRVGEKTYPLANPLGWRVPSRPRSPRAAAPRAAAAGARRGGASGTRPRRDLRQLLLDLEGRMASVRRRCGGQEERPVGGS